MIGVMERVAMLAVLSVPLQVALGQAPTGQGENAQSINSSVPPGVVRTDVTTIRALTMTYSVQMAQAALDTCETSDPHVAVVIVDTAGNPRLIMVADGAKASLVEAARRKGFTAAVLRQVTSVEQKMIAANPLIVIPPQTSNLIEPGGVPIRAGTQVIGGIGVEGGDPMEAEKCAQAGVNRLNETLHPEVPAGGIRKTNSEPVLPKE